MRLAIIAICIIILILATIAGIYPKILYPSNSKASSEQIAQMEVNSKLCFRDSECTTPCEDKLSCNANYVNIYFQGKTPVECKLNKDNCKPFERVICLDNECSGVSRK